MKQLLKKEIVVAIVGHVSAQALRSVIHKEEGVKAVVVGNEFEQKQTVRIVNPYVIDETRVNQPEPISGRESRNKKRKQNRTDKFGNKRK